MNVGLKRVKNLYEQSRANVRWGRVIKIDSSVPSTSAEVVEVTEEQRMEKENSNNDENYLKEIEQSGNLQNRFTYRNSAIAAVRYRVGSRATAALVNAPLKDMGLLNDSNL